MTHRERIGKIYASEPADRPGFWLGDPSEGTRPPLFAHYGVDGDEALRRRVDDDCRWQPVEWSGGYKHPDGLPMFDIMHGLGPKKSHGQPGCFAETTDIGEVDAHPWPDPLYLDLEPIRNLSETTSDCWRLGGTWSSFFHLAADYFGMDNYFTKMYTDPEVVHAVTRHIVDFFLDANRRVFEEIGDCVDAFFFGNDFGTQEDLLISPEKFREFVLPYFAELIALAKSYGKPTQLHSCGAISKVIPWLIDAGMDALHPLQARARGMDAETLAREFKGKIVFVGGVDTQELMWRGTPRQVKEEVARLREVFGERWIISPSHEVLMPEVPVQNIVALCEAATG